MADDFQFVRRPDAVIAYRIQGTAQGRPLVLVGSPMSAAGFATLQGFFPDRLVVTYDPRGVEHSTRAETGGVTMPEQHADDIAAVIEAVGRGPVQVFASSGGAVNALALVQSRPELVTTLVAHEPPLAEYLPDREAVLKVVAAIRDTYLRDGFGPAMARFLDLVEREGEVPADLADEPTSDPAAKGLPTEDDGSRDDPMLSQNMVSSPSFVPNLERLRGVHTRVVVAAGVQSRNQLTGRAAAALASALGVRLALMPSHHAGFLGGEFGQTGEPEAFAARLRELLS